MEEALSLLRANNLRAAAAHFQTALERSSQGSDEARECLLQLGKLYSNARRRAEAARFFSRALSEFPTSLEVAVAAAEDREKAGAHAEAAELFKRCIGLLVRAGAARQGARLSELWLSFGWELVRCGDADSAGKAFSKVLEKEPENPRALLGMASVLRVRIGSRAAQRMPLRLETDDPMMQVLLQPLMVINKTPDQESPAFRMASDAFIDALLEPGGMERFRWLQTVEYIWQKPQGLLKQMSLKMAEHSFQRIGVSISSCAKGMEPSIELLSWAVAANPASVISSYYLSQSWDFLGCPRGALQTICAFFACNPSLSYCGVRCREVLEIVQPLGLPPWRADAWPDPQPGVVASGKEHLHVLSVGEKDSQEACLLLDLFAHAAKLVFVSGNLQLFAPLSSLILPLYAFRDASRSENQRVFFQISASSFRTLPPPIPADVSLPAIWAIGESHVLPVGWRVVSVGGILHVVRPLLCMAATIWSISKEKNFRHKNFWKLIEQIPRGAKVMAILGELDCRDSVPNALKKLKYDSEAEALDVLTQIYERIIREIVAKKQPAALFVHPVPHNPGCSFETAHGLNTRLAAAFQPSKIPRVAFLDFAERLLGPDGKPDPTWSLDGHHLSPSYVEALLKPAIEAAFSQL